MEVKYNIMHIEIVSNLIKFRTNLTSKLTIVSDESYKGKTATLNLLKSFLDSKTVISCELPVILVENTTNLRDGCVLLIDEKFIEATSVKLLEFAFKNLESYFLIVTRYSFKSVHYSIDSIKKFSVVDSYNILVTKYEPLYVNAINKLFEQIYIEDSTTGLAFFKRINSNIVTTHGKDNYNIIPNNHKRTLFILDRCGFGSSIESLASREDFNKTLFVLDYESFEAFILELIRYPIVIPELTYNKEQYYTEVLQRVMTRYTKSEKCRCIINCSCNKDNCVCKGLLLNPTRMFAKSKYGGVML